MNKAESDEISICGEAKGWYKLQEFEDAQLELVAAQSAFKITQPAFYGIANSVKRFELDAEKTTSSDAQSLEMTRLEFEPEPIKLDFDPLKFDVPSD